MSGISLTQTNGGIVPVNPDIEFIQGNDSVPVGPNPTTHIVLLLGDNTQGIDLSGNAGSYTETITALDATTAQKGVVLLASNAETIAGTVTTKATTPDDIKAKLGAQTLHGLPYGNATTGAIQWLAEATNGQLPIGSTGNAPVLANITSSDGSVKVTNGPGTIDLTANGNWSEQAVNFNAVVEHSYFVTSTVTVTLPASGGLVLGNSVTVFADTTDVVTIQAGVGEFIQYGENTSVSGGVLASTTQGSAVQLVYRPTDSTWHTLSSEGTWGLT